MRARSWVWILMAALWACDDADAPAAGDAGLDRGTSVDGAPADGGARDASPLDSGAPDASPDAEVFEVNPINCPPAPEEGPTPLEVEAPGSWWLEGCEGRVALRFTVPPRTAWFIEVTSGADQPPIVPMPGGENALDTPIEATSEIFFETTHSPVVTIRWVECWEVDSCGADRYCARGTNACTPCADGDEMFDTRMTPAPRTDAAPRALPDQRGSGVVCPGFDDWYVTQLPAGQPLNVSRELNVLAYVANPAAQTLAQLEPLPFANVEYLYVDVEDRIVAPTEVDRTVWLRLTTDEGDRRYAFDLPGCANSYMCLPWWQCERAQEVGACQACDGAHDVHGDDNIRTSPGAAPIPLSAGDALDGAVCGIDEDWYAVPLGDPASRIEITGAMGWAYAAGPAAGEARDDFFQQSLGVEFLDVGSTITLRSDTPEWYPDGQAPEIVWVHIGHPDPTEFGPTRPYTIRVEDGDFCAPEREVNCRDGRVCDAATGRCIAEE